MKTVYGICSHLEIHFSHPHTSLKKYIACVNGKDGYINANGASYLSLWLSKIAAVIIRVEETNVIIIEHAYPIIEAVYESFKNAENRNASEIWHRPQPNKIRIKIVELVSVKNVSWLKYLPNP
jgi:hypothetical protein